MAQVKRPIHEGDRLIAIAKKAVSKAKVRNEPLTRAEAMADALWRKSYPAALERAFRETYATALEERGSAKPARPSGASGASQTDEDRAARGLGRLTLRVSQTALDKFKAESQRIGCSQAALFESLASKF